MYSVRKPILISLAALALASAGMVAAPIAAQADGGNCGQYNTTTDGMFSSFQSAIFGGRGKYEPMNADLCTTPGVASNSFTGAWTMVSARSATLPQNPSAVGFAQVGYGDFGQNSP